MLGLNSDSAAVAVKWLGIVPLTLLYLMNILSPIPVAIEHMIVIAFPFHHRSIMTTKTIATMLAVMLGASATMNIMITAFIPFDIVWSLALIHWHPIFHAIVAVPRLISIVCIVAANGFLQYKITVSNRKAEENQRLGNEEEAS